MKSMCKRNQISDNEMYLQLNIGNSNYSLYNKYLHDLHLKFCTVMFVILRYKINKSYHQRCKSGNSMRYLVILINQIDHRLQFITYTVYIGNENENTKGVY